ncbi:MAG: MotA/TolQ/ExbB proton channel family protein [Deltaproteobacteria bacterium]|nr:MotA/TolQ/ExbB proton channel family protein [Deltaproteobacteria bacterium]
MSELIGLFERGGPTMFAIAAIAVGAFALFVERWLAVRGLVPMARRLGRRVRDAAAAGDMPTVLARCSEASHELAPVLGRGVETAMRGGDRGEIFAVMAREARRLSIRVRRGLGLLATLGTMSPFLGLLGTVLGIMTALKDLGEKGQAGYEVVAVGVAEALITTAAGIVVAVVVVLLHQTLKAHLAHVVLELQLLVEEVADHLAKARGATPAAPAEGESHAAG